MSPKVTFIVPCYNLAHLLTECIDSILCQSYNDFEVLIMDDCSPDNTPEVAQSFNDPRVIHVRNETNLRHLANYNKGIQLAKGKYIWLISADDKLRKPYLLERYVELMDDHPEVGYIFCPAMGLQNGDETEIIQWSYLGNQNIIFKGHEFLKKLFEGNRVCAPCGMVRRNCYDIERFPLDLPYAGDWYLWCLFSLHFDVAYLGESMVNYRLHDQSFTSFFLNEGIKQNIADEINVRWRIMRKAEAAGYESLARSCRTFIVKDYVSRIQMKEDDSHRQGLSIEDFEQSLIGHARNQKEENYFRSMVFFGLADRCYWKKEFVKAATYYKNSIRLNPGMLEAWMKYVFIALGRTGIVLRSASSCIRRTFYYH